MHKRSILFLLLLCFLLLVGCAGSNANDSSAPSAAAKESALSLYSDAINDISSKDSYSLKIVYSRNFEAGTEVFHETRNQLLQLSHISGPNMSASVREDVTIGNRTITYDETYYGGTSYLSFDGASFCGDVSADEFLQRFVPAVLLTPEYYNDVVYSQNSDQTVTLQFYNPNKPESWAVPENATLVDAVGRVVLSQEGILQESHCYLSYTVNDIAITLTVSVTPDLAPTSPQPPKDPDAYRKVNSVYATRYLEESCCYLLQCDDVAFTGTQSARSDAFEEDRIKTVNIKMSGSNEALRATIDTHLKQIDNSLGGNTTELAQTETYIDGVYTVVSDEEQTVTDDSVSSETMQSYCRDIFVEDIPLAGNILSADLTQDASQLVLTFTASDDMSGVLRKKASQILCGDETFLDSVSGEHTTDQLLCVLTVNAQTGLITNADITYAGSFTVEDALYQLDLQILQTYALAGIPDTAAP